MTGKMVQLDFFIKEKKDLEEQVLANKEESIKRQLRMLHHCHGDLTKRMDKQEAIMEQLVEFLLNEPEEAFK